MVQEITDKDFESFSKSKGVVVVDCWAAWCGPCKALSPVIDELSKEMSSVKFGKLNVDENMESPAKYGIASIPTLLVFKDGELVDRLVGFKPKLELQKRFSSY